MKDVIKQALKATLMGEVNTFKSTIALHGRDAYIKDRINYLHSVSEYPTLHTSWADLIIINMYNECIDEILGKHFI